MKKFFMTVALVAATCGAANAQGGMQLGANLGATMGMSMKYNMSAAHAIEGILGYNINHNGLSIKAMYQYHIPLVDALNLYMGGGMNIGGNHLGDHGDGDFAIGLVPSIGLEYKLKTAPVGFAFGYEPAINFTSCDTWNDVAFKVRYRF